MRRAGVLRPLTRPAGPGHPDSVYPPREDSRILVEFAGRPGAKSVLDIGTGSGVAAVAAARTGAFVVATDLNPEALRRVARLALEEGVRVHPVRTDLARGLRAFGRIVANPPYLPTPPGSEDPDRWIHLALDGGPDGLATTRRLVEELREHLLPGGEAFLVGSSRQDRGALARLRRSWRGTGGQWQRVAQRRLEGEVLTVERLTRRSRAGAHRPTYGARRTGAARRGTAPRRRSPRPTRRGSNPGPGPGRSRAPGGASGRRRSPRGS